MDKTQFIDSLGSKQPPETVGLHLKALWYDASGDWTLAHKLIQDEDDHTSAAIHAYLHRKEGDDWNADYWYRRAGRSRFNGTLESEWQAMVTELIAK